MKSTTNHHFNPNLHIRFSAKMNAFLVTKIWKFAYFIRPVHWTFTWASSTHHASKTYKMMDWKAMTSAAQFPSCWQPAATTPTSTNFWTNWTKRNRSCRSAKRSTAGMLKTMKTTHIAHSKSSNVTLIHRAFSPTMHGYRHSYCGLLMLPATLTQQIGIGCFWLRKLSSIDCLISMAIFISGIR